MYINQIRLCRESLRIFRTDVPSDVHPYFHLKKLSIITASIYKFNRERTNKINYSIIIDQEKLSYCHTWWWTVSSNENKNEYPMKFLFEIYLEIPYTIWCDLCPKILFFTTWILIYFNILYVSLRNHKQSKLDQILMQEIIFLD